LQISLFEDLVDNTIEDTKSIPQDVATTGKVNMSRRDIMKHIGELFILRININLQGSVLDSPELMWAVSLHFSTSILEQYVDKFGYRNRN
jgi:uncharacterized Rmd1/YagE family protein